MKKMKYILLFLLFTAVNHSQAEVPLKDFFKFSQADSLTLSPNGKYYAVIAELFGGRQLFIMDRESKKIIYKFKFPNKNEAGRVTWLTDDRFMVSMNRRVGALAQSAGTGFYFAANANGTKKIQLWPPAQKRAGATRGSPPKGFGLVDTLDNEPRKILVQMYDGKRAGIYKVDIFSGRHQLMESAPSINGNLVVDRDNSAKMFFKRDEDDWNKQIVYIKNSSGKWEEFETYDAKEGGLRPIDFSDNGESVIVYYDNENSPSGIYSLNLDSKKLELLNEVKGDADIENYIYDYKYKNPEVVGVRRQPDYPVVEFFNSDNKKAQLQSSMEASFDDKFVRIGRPTKDGKLALVSVFSDKNPGEFYLYDAEKGSIKFEMASRPWIDEKQMSDRSPIAFKARDGLEIRGYLTLPKHKAKNLPMVLLVHGGPYGPKDTWFFQPEAQFLANRGYAVLQVNYRGSGGRGRDFQYDAYRKMGMEMQDDLTDATLWAIDKGIADKNRICIYGASYGGYASLMGVIKEPDLYQCAIGYAGAYDIGVQRDESDTATVEAGEKFLDEAWNAYNEDFVRERSPVYHVDKITAALLLVHGDADPRTPIEGYDALTNALDKVDHPYEALVKPNEGHGFYDRENTYEFYGLMEQFLRKHIGTKKTVTVERVQSGK